MLNKKSFYNDRLRSSKAVNIKAFDFGTESEVEQHIDVDTSFLDSIEPVCTCGCCCSVEEIKGILDDAMNDPSFRIIESQEQLGNNYYNAQDDTNDSQSITQ